MPIDSSEGRIYLDANIKAEEGGGSVSEKRARPCSATSEDDGTPEAKKLGWTAGQNGTSEDEKCLLPLGNGQILMGADGTGRLLLFDVTSSRAATVNVLHSGGRGRMRSRPGDATQRVDSGEPVTKIPKGKTASLSLNVFAADTQSVEWRFADNGKAEADEPPVIESYPFPTQVPTLTHEFKHGGNYEIIAMVEPDDFGPKIEVHSNVTVEGGEETKQEEEAKQKREEEAKKRKKKPGKNAKKREEEAKQEEEEGKHNEEAEEKTRKKKPEDRKKKPSKEAEKRKPSAEEERSDGAPIGAEFSYTSPATVSQPAKFAAKVTDPNNKASPHAQYKYVWEFGDGATAEGGGGREFRAEHAYAIEGRYEVKLRSPTKRAGPRRDTRGPGERPAGPGEHSELGRAGGRWRWRQQGGGRRRRGGRCEEHPCPQRHAAGTTSLVVGGSGGVRLKLACPAGEASCSGTVTLRTMGAVKASTRGRKRVLTLAAGSFTVVGGRVKVVTLHLSAEARALLARAHVLRVRATLQAHDPAGATRTTQTIVTLRLGRSSHRR